MSNQYAFPQEMTPSFVSNGKQLPASAPLTDSHLAAFQWSLLQQSHKQQPLHLSNPIMMRSSFSSSQDINLGPEDSFTQDDHGSWSMANQTYPTDSLHAQVNGSASLHPQLFLPIYPEQWNSYANSVSPNEATQSSPNHMMMNNYPPSGSNSLSPFAMQTPSNFAQLSPTTNSDPSLSPLYGTSRLSTPTTPASSQSFMSSPTFLPSPILMPSPTPSQEEHLLQQDSQVDTNRPGYTHRQQLQLFREALTLQLDGAGPFIPQLMYKPHTTSDRKRYVEDVRLEPPIYFYVEHSGQCGISLHDALHSRVKNLVNREQVVFEGRGPSVSIRLEWPGYRQWSRQIPTKDFRSPPGPITIAKLAKNVAKCVQRFMLDRKMLPMEDGADDKWRIGDRPGDIKVEDLMLVSIHHVSLGSWQPHLRLRRPPPSIRIRSSPVEYSTANNALFSY